MVSLPPQMRILLCIIVLLYSANQIVAQTESFVLDPSFPSKIALGDSVTIKIRVTALTGGALPSIDNIHFDGIDGFMRVTSKSDEGAGVYSFTLETLKLTDNLEITVKVGDRVGEAIVFKEKKVLGSFQK